MNVDTAYNSSASTSQKSCYSVLIAGCQCDTSGPSLYWRDGTMKAIWILQQPIPPQKTLTLIVDSRHERQRTFHNIDVKFEGRGQNPQHDVFIFKKQSIFQLFLTKNLLDHQKDWISAKEQQVVLCNFLKPYPHIHFLFNTQRRFTYSFNLSVTTKYVSILNSLVLKPNISRCSQELLGNQQITVPICTQVVDAVPLCSKFNILFNFF